MADREGRLRDRPEQIKAELFPYENQNVSRLLSALAQPNEDGEAFITRYSVNGKRYIQINKFLKHQNPHVKEAPSEIPSIIVGNTEPGASTGLAPEIPERAPEIPERAGRTPDSGLLTPSSLTPDSGLRTADYPSPGSPSARPEILVLVWNEVASQHQLPPCRALGTSERLQNATDRWREKPEPSYWRNIAERIASSPFLRGKKGWRATFDFFVEPDTHVKVLEGAYDEAPHENAKTTNNARALTAFVRDRKAALT